MTNTKLKICVIGPSGGHVNRRVRYLADLGHEVTFITDSDTPMPNIQIVPLHTFAFAYRKNSFHKLKMFFLLLWNFYKIFKNRQFDLVQVHYAAFFSAWMAFVFIKKPLVVSTMGGDILFEEQGNYNHLEKWMIVKLLTKAQLITAKSQAMIDRLRRFGVSQQKILKLIWGVNTEVFFPALPDKHLQNKLNINVNNIVLCSPKGLRPLYNIHLLVEALDIVKKKFPEAILLITEFQADEQYKNQLLEQIKALKLEQSVRFIGEIAHDSIPKYYHLMDITLGIPQSDGVPQSMFEALASGVPLILGNLTRYQEFVTHKKDVYFVDFNGQSIAQGIIEILSEKALRTQLIQQGLDNVKTNANLEVELLKLQKQFEDLSAAKKRFPKLSFFKKISFIIALFLVYHHRGKSNLWSKLFILKDNPL